jgi:CBS domain-containing protein
LTEEDKPSFYRTVLVSEVMTSPAITLNENATVSEAATLMLVNRTGSVVIVNNMGDYAGILTERMILPEEVLLPFMRRSAFRLLGHEIGDFEHIEETMEKVRDLAVGTVMSKSNPIAKPDAHIAEVAERMVAEGCHHVCVVDDKKPVGMMSRHDLLRLFLNPAGDPARR